MRVLLCLFFAIFTFGVELQNEYKIQGNEIYSSDLVKNAPRFFVARFGNAFEFSVPSDEIISLFDRYSIKLKSASENIKFVYQTPKEFLGLQKQIRDYFLKAYPTLKIQKIYLRTLGKVSGDVFEASLTLSILKKNRFEFFAKSNQKEGGVVFVCEIVGEIEVFVASKDIRSRQSFDKTNITKQTLPFSGFFQEPASQEEIEKSQAKTFIKSDQIITRNKLAPKTLVQKGEMIDAFLQEGGVRIELRVEALKNAVLGEVISAKNPTSKKILKVKITAQGKGEVQ